MACGAAARVLPWLAGLHLLWATLVLTGVALVAGGMVVGRLTGRPVLGSGARQLVLGGLAIAVTFTVGHLIGAHA
jgi:vacuolar iron transporter family protein